MATSGNFSTHPASWAARRVVSFVGDDVPNHQLAEHRIGDRLGVTLHGQQRHVAGGRGFAGEPDRRVAAGCVVVVPDDHGPGPARLLVQLGAANDHDRAGGVSGHRGRSGPDQHALDAAQSAVAEHQQPGPASLGRQIIGISEATGRLHRNNDTLRCSFFHSARGRLRPVLCPGVGGNYP